MKAFISYSHADERYLTLLVKHLSLLKRDNEIHEWTDQAIEAGGDLKNEIDSNLSSSDLFIALLSPDYIQSNYCYEIEFEKAQSLKAEGKLKIIPIIVEDCDWLNSPFADMKALPKDGKAVANWSNENTAMLDVIQRFRKLIHPVEEENKFIHKVPSKIKDSRLYKVQKDFDSIQKTEFIEGGFKMLRQKLNDNLQELLSIEGINAKKMKDNDNEFVAILVNRNKIKTEATITLISSQIENKSDRQIYFGSSKYFLGYEIITGDNSNTTKRFALEYDDFEMYWKSQDFHAHNRQADKFSIDEIVELCWNDWLHAIGIVY